MMCYSFNATVMLEMLRGKRMLFVGDQLNRGQYLSLICMLHRGIPDGAKSFESVDSLSIFRAKVRSLLCWLPSVAGPLLIIGLMFALSY